MLLLATLRYLKSAVYPTTMTLNFWKILLTSHLLTALGIATKKLNSLYFNAECTHACACVWHWSGIRWPIIKCLKMPTISKLKLLIATSYQYLFPALLFYWCKNVIRIWYKEFIWTFSLISNISVLMLQHSKRQKPCNFLCHLPSQTILE